MLTSEELEKGDILVSLGGNLWGDGKGPLFPAGLLCKVTHLWSGSDQTLGVDAPETGCKVVRTKLFRKATIYEIDLYKQGNRRVTIQPIVESYPIY